MACIIIHVISLFLIATIVRLLLCEWGGLLLGNQLYHMKQLGSQVPPWCAWDLYFVVASFNFPPSMIQIVVDSVCNLTIIIMLNSDPFEHHAAAKK